MWIDGQTMDRENYDPGPDYDYLWERANKGLQLIKEKQPHLLKEINTNTLDISSDCGCIMGQAFGNFHNEVGWELLGIGKGDAYLYGFDGGTSEEQDELTDIWKELLNA